MQSYQIVHIKLISLGEIPFLLSWDYEYVALIIEGKRLLIDIDIKSEFETARSTKNYKRSCNLCRPFSSASRTACTKPGALRLV
ncbi:hypothetical protein AAC387_Pa04g1897 [Persea americana]